MRQLIFSHDANPAIDPPVCKKSNFYAQSLLDSYKAIRIGINKIQMLPPESESDARDLAGSTMRASWHIKPSGGFYVWQMYPQSSSEALSHEGLSGSTPQPGSIEPSRENAAPVS